MKTIPQIATGRVCLQALILTGARVFTFALPDLSHHRAFHGAPGRVASTGV
jgi:hypothetical protein